MNFFSEIFFFSRVDNNLVRSVTQTLGLKKQPNGSMVKSNMNDDSSDSSPDSDSQSSVSAIKALPTLDPTAADLVPHPKLAKQISKKPPKLAAIKAKNDVSKTKGSEAFNKHKTSQHILTSMTSGYKSFSSDMLNELADSYNNTTVENENVKSVLEKYSPKESQILPRSPLAKTAISNSISVPLKMSYTLEVTAAASIKSSKLSIKSDGDKSKIARKLDADLTCEETINHIVDGNIIASDNHDQNNKYTHNTEFQTADESAPICKPEESTIESSDTESKLSSTLSLPDFSLEKTTAKLPKPASEYQLGGGGDTVAEIQANSLGLVMKKKKKKVSLNGSKTRSRACQTHKKYQITYV